jgi:hypothetical protein
VHPYGNPNPNPNPNPKPDVPKHDMHPCAARFRTEILPLSFTPLLHFKRCRACDPMTCPVEWTYLLPVDTVNSIEML